MRTLILTLFGKFEKFRIYSLFEITKNTRALVNMGRPHVEMCLICGGISRFNYININSTLNQMWRLVCTGPCGVIYIERI